MQEGEAVQGPEERPDWGRVSVVAVLKGVAFALAALGVIVGVHAYIASRIAGGLGLSGLGEGTVWAIVSALFLVMLAGLFARRLAPPAGAVLRWIAYVWMGLFVVVGSSIALTELASALYLAATDRGGARWGLGQVVFSLSFAALTFAWGFFRALAPARVERVAVTIGNLPSAFEGYRIVQLSDVHLGETMGVSFARRIVRQVNALRPDVVAITGDLADGSAAQVREAVAPLAELEAKDGVFFVTGNHEYYNGHVGWLAEVRRLGMRVLLNEHHVVSRGEARLVLGGVTDYNAGEFTTDHVSRPDLAVAGAPEGAPRVLLAHQPRTAHHARGLGIDLQLSGHTHGGQFFPWTFFTRLQQPVLAGLSTIDGVRVYTHRGTGFWGPPLRLFAPPEIAEIVLRRG